MIGEVISSQLLLPFSFSVISFVIFQIELGLLPITCLVLIWIVTSKLANCSNSIYFLKMQGLKMALSMIDLTTLEGKDTPGKVRQLCYKAQHLHDSVPGIPHVAAVCVYPNMVSIAKDELKYSEIKIASVATSFPAGMSTLIARLDEIQFAVDSGADEVDMVISRGKFLCGDYGAIYEEVQRSKEICGDVHLKVILETGELSTLDNVRKASEIAMSSGADFIKTSTGFSTGGATEDAVHLMKKVAGEKCYGFGPYTSAESC